MDRTDELREILKRVFAGVEAITPSENGLTTELICDDRIGHYQLGQVGWEGKRRVDDIYLHVDVINGKVWIQHDGTNLKLAEMLEREGVRRDEIVLGFHRPERRELTDYAVA